MARGLRYLPVGPVLEAYPYPQEALAETVGVSRRTICRWVAAGRLRRCWADPVADGLGVHPYELWGDAYYDAWGLL